MNLSDIKKRLSRIPIWRGEFSIKPLVGGITNQNFVITDKEKKYVARFGNDLVHHQVMRFHEVAASKAAHAAGIAPEVIYHEIGVQILEHINSSPLTSSEVKSSIDFDYINYTKENLDRYQGEKQKFLSIK